jgi:hypothetical protein
VVLVGALVFFQPLLRGETVTEEPVEEPGLDPGQTPTVEQMRQMVRGTGPGPQMPEHSPGDSHGH